MLAVLPPLSDTITATSDDEDDEDLLDLLIMYYILKHASVEMNGIKCFYSKVPPHAQKMAKQMCAFGRFQVVIDRATQVIEELCEIPSPYPSINPLVVIID